MGSHMTTVAYISTALCIQAGLQCIISAYMYIAQNTIYLKFNSSVPILKQLQPRQMLYGVKYVLLNACHGLERIYIV